MRRESTFQCPETGGDVVAKFYFGKLMLAPAENSVHYDESSVDYDASKLLEETRSWCREHGDKKFSSAGRAADYLHRLGVPEISTEGIRYGSSR